MSLSDHELNIYLDEIEFYAAEEPLDFVEVSNFENSQEPIINTGILPEKDIEQWLQKEPLTQNGERLCGGLQLLMSSGCCENTFERPPLEIRRATFVQIIKALKLPLAYVEAVARHGGIHARVVEAAHNDKSPFIIYIIKPPPGGFHFLECTLLHNSNSGITRGFLRSNIAGATNFFLRRIATSVEQASHPLFLATLFAEWQKEMVSKICLTISSMLVQIEARTGFTTFDHTPLLRKIGSRVTNPNYFDCLRIDLSRTNYLISIQDLFAQHVDRLCKFALNSFEHDLIAVPEQRKSFVQRDALVLRQRISCTMNSCSYSQLQICMYGKRAQFQLSTVHNLIAQEDSVRNIEIAKDSKSIAWASKRDSSSMRSIAVLTTVFLPGTFISAFFATPLFNWDAPSGESVLTGRFWIFWAVTIPLTFVLIGAWWLWMRLQEGFGRKKDMSSEEVDHKLDMA